MTVGTVHYMAPEIGAGKYDRSIDIYALGAVLYEMLTGMVPFTGASPTEVLMKHLGTLPDVSSIAEPFATVMVALGGPSAAVSRPIYRVQPMDPAACSGMARDSRAAAS